MSQRVKFIFIPLLFLFFFHWYLKLIFRFYFRYEKNSLAIWSTINGYSCIHFWLFTVRRWGLTLSIACLILGCSVKGLDRTINERKQRLHSKKSLRRDSICWTNLRNFTNEGYDLRWLNLKKKCLTQRIIREELNISLRKKR